MTVPIATSFQGDWEKETVPDPISLGPHFPRMCAACPAVGSERGAVFQFRGSSPRSGQGARTYKTDPRYPCSFRAASSASKEWINSGST
jgi:hypothetical protein